MKELIEEIKSLRNRGSFESCIYMMGIYTGFEACRNEVLDILKDYMKPLDKPDSEGWWFNNEFESFVWVYNNAETNKTEFGVYTFLDGTGEIYLTLEVDESEGKWIKAIVPEKE